MKRVLLILLAVCILLSSFACQKNEEPQGGEVPTEASLADLQIVCQSNLMTGVSELTSSIAQRAKEATGTAPKVISDRMYQAGEGTELLVGDVNETTDAAKAEIKRNGYAIVKDGKRISVVGTSRAFTVVALQEFCQNFDRYVNEEGNFSLEKPIISSNMPVVTLTKDFPIIYSDLYDDDPVYEEVPSETEYSNGGIDAIVSEAGELSSALQALFGSGTNSFLTASDQKTAASGEILFGRSNRTQSEKVLAGLAENAYIITALDGKLILGGWSTPAVKVAREQFVTYLGYCETSEGVYQIPEGYTRSGVADENWVIDFPRPEGTGIEFLGNLDCNNGQLQYTYEGTGVNAALFVSYRDSLKAAGYTVLQEEEIEGSHFATLRNDKTDVLLYVNFYAYTHQAEAYQKYAAYYTKQEAAYAEFSPKIEFSYEPMLKVISAKASATVLPDLTPDLNYTKVFNKNNVGADTGSLLTMMHYHKKEYETWGNGFIVMLEDGSFFVMDGGANTEGSNEEERLYGVLKNMQKLVGRENEPIVLAGWFLSHAHGDHYGNFFKFCEKYGQEITLERVYTNVPAWIEVANSLNPSGSGNYDKLVSKVGLLSGDPEIVKLHTGETFWVRNLEIKVLYTHEDMYPSMLCFYNDTSTVLDIRHHVTDGNGNLADGAKVQRSIWLGDLYRYGSRIVSAMYGDWLKADTVQVAHHGYKGCEYALYEYISPTVVFWPTYGAHFKSTTNDSLNSWHEYVDRDIRYNLASVKAIFVAGDVTATSSSTTFPNRHDFTVKFTKSALDYNKACHLDTGDGLFDKPANVIK